MVRYVQSLNSAGNSGRAEEKTEVMVKPGRILQASSAVSMFAAGWTNRVDRRHKRTKYKSSCCKLLLVGMKTCLWVGNLLPSFSMMGSSVLEDAGRWPDGIPVLQTRRCRSINLEKSAGARLAVQSGKRRPPFSKPTLGVRGDGSLPLLLGTRFPVTHTSSARPSPRLAIRTTPNLSLSHYAPVLTSWSGLIFSFSLLNVYSLCNQTCSSSSPF